jgi:hypothetical protein
MKKILISIPTASPYLHRKFVQSLHQLKYPTGYKVEINILEGYQIPFARNHAAELALEKECSHLFFIDADMIFPGNSLEKLLSNDKDICHALSFRRIKPHYPCIFKWIKETECYETVDYSDKSSLFTVDAAGSACTLIKTDVFKKMKKPWYYYRDHTFSSDLTFSWDAQKAGFEIWIDKELKTGHIGSEIVVTEEFYLNELSSNSKEVWTAQMKKHVKEKELYKKN